VGKPSGERARTLSPNSFLALDHSGSSVICGQCFSVGVPTTCPPPRAVSGGGRKHWRGGARLAQEGGDLQDLVKLVSLQHLGLLLLCASEQRFTREQLADMQPMAHMSIDLV